METPPSPLRALLVEGPDDKHVVYQLCQQHGIQLDLSEIIDKGGLEKLLPSIENEVLVTSRTILGIIVDADDKRDDHWRAISDRLRNVQVWAPPGPLPGGVIIEGIQDVPRVGIWIMPDNLSQGQIEDLVANMIPTEDPVWPLAQAYVDGIPRVHQKFAIQKTLRAKVHAWLATRKDPRKMGEAIHTGDLDHNVGAATQFADWLRALFR